MTLDVSRALKNPGVAYPFSIALTLEPQDILGDRVLFEGIVASGEFTGTGQSVRLTGRVAGTANLPCARCLKSCDLPLDETLGEVYVKEGDEQNPDHRQLTGFSIEMDQLALESLVLALPMRFLCDRECKGLCPGCGADLNQGTCDCSPSLNVWSGDDDEEVC